MQSDRHERAIFQEVRLQKVYVATDFGIEATLHVFFPQPKLHFREDIDLAAMPADAERNRASVTGRSIQHRPVFPDSSSTRFRHTYHVVIFPPV